MQTKIEYNLVTSLLEDSANSIDPTFFESIEEAFEYWEINYKNRNKKDGYDEHWRKTPFMVQQIITNNLWDSYNTTLAIIAKKEKSFIGKLLEVFKKK